MPDRRKLKIGDSIRVLNVPQADLEQLRQQQTISGDELGTVKVYEIILEKYPVVIIDNIDEYQQPWFTVHIRTHNTFESHSLAIMDDDHWEIVYQLNSDIPPPTEHLIAQVMNQIDSVLEEYEDEYQVLAERSEKLNTEQELLKKDYAKLDQLTGLNALFQKLAELKTEK